MKNYLISGIVFIMLVNVVVLAGVAYNRSEPYIHTIELTGRELRLPYGLRLENSATVVRLVTRMPMQSEYEDKDNQSILMAPLTKQQLNELGLNDAEYPQSQHEQEAIDYFYKQYQIEVFVALELNGTQYQRMLNTKKEQLHELETAMASNVELEPDYKVTTAQSQYEHERDEASRLFFVDAHKDKQVLMQRYQDQTNVFVTKGTVNVTYDNFDAAYSVSYADLLVEQIMLPKDIAKMLPTDNPSDNNISYTLHIGKRFEPWISQLRFH